MTLTIHDVAGRAAGWRALDLVLFEVCGRWTADADDGAVAALWAAVSNHHAWHAELWAQRFPTIPGLDLERADVEASTGSTLCALRTSLAGATSTGERLALLAAALAAHGDDLHDATARVDERLDAPTHRTLTLVIADVASELAACAALAR